MTIGAVAEIKIQNPGALSTPVIHRVATAAMKERLRADIRAEGARPPVTGTA